MEKKKKFGTLECKHRSTQLAEMKWRWNMKANSWAVVFNELIHYVWLIVNTKQYQQLFLDKLETEMLSAVHLSLNQFMRVSLKHLQIYFCAN